MPCSCAYLHTGRSLPPSQEPALAQSRTCCTDSRVEGHAPFLLMLIRSARAATVPGQPARPPGWGSNPGSGVPALQGPPRPLQAQVCLPTLPAWLPRGQGWVCLSSCTCPGSTCRRAGRMRAAGPKTKPGTGRSWLLGHSPHQQQLPSTPQLTHVLAGMLQMPVLLWLHSCFSDQHPPCPRTPGPAFGNTPATPARTLPPTAPSSRSPGRSLA